MRIMGKGTKKKYKKVAVPKANISIVFSITSEFLLLHYNFKRLT